MKLNFLDEGQGAPIVLLHPVGLDARCWAPIVPLLSAQNRLIRLDLRGHGQSGGAELGLTVADYAQDVAVTLEALNLGPATVVGLSFGGMIAQELAIRHPALVARLVVSGCPSTFPEAVRPVLAGRGKPALEGGMEAILPETIERWFTPEARDAGLEVINEIAAVLRQTAPLAWAAAWQAIGGLDTLPRLGAVTAPSLAIAGERDPASPPAALKAIAKAIPEGRLLVLSGAPHIMHAEASEAYAAAILDFMAGAEVGSRPVA